MATAHLRFHKSLRGRLLAALAFVALISVGGLGLAAYLNERAALEAQVTAQLTSVADLKKEQIITWLDERHADVRLLAVNKLNQEHLTEILSPYVPPERKAEFTSFLADNLTGLQQSRAGYSRIALFDIKGTIVTATDPALEGRVLTGDPTFKETLAAPDGEFIRDIHLDPDSGLIEMEFGHVIRAVDPVTLEETPEVIGVVIITVNMNETIYPLIRAWPGMGNTGETLLVRPEGNGTLFLNNLRFDPDAALNLRIPSDSPDAKPAYLSSRGAEGIIQTPDYRGMPVLAAYRHIPGIGWGFVAKEDLDEAFAPVDALARRVGLVAIAVFLVAGGVSVVISRPLTRPLAELVRGTQAVAAGDLTTQINIAREGEIGALADSFRAMVLSLNQRQRQVETVRGILHSLNATPDVIEAFPTIVKGLRATIDFESISLALYDQSRESFSVVALDQPLAVFQPGLSLTALNTAVVADLLAGRPHLTPALKVETDLLIDRLLYEAGYRSRISLPLRIEERVIGALSLGWLRPAGYDPADLSLLGQIADAVALAVERSRLFDQVVHRSTELAALNDLSLAVNSSLEPSQVLQMAVERTADLLDADRADIFLLRDDSKLHVGAKSAQSHPVGDHERLVIARNLWEPFSTSNESIQLIHPSELSKKLPPVFELEKQGVQSIELLRLAHGGVPLGVLMVLFPRPEVTAEEAQLAQTIAQVINPAIAHAQSYYLTYEQLQLTNQRLTLVNQIARRLSAILEVDRLLAEVVQLVQGSLGCSQAGVGLVEGDEVVYRIGVVGGQLVHPGIRLKIGRQGISEWVAAHGQPIRVSDVTNDPHYYSHPALTGVCSELAVPIRLANHTSGVLLVASDRQAAFDEKDQALLQAIADQLALALQNARSYSQLHEQAEILAQTNAELERATQAKTDFINRMNHELRTPLTVILGFTELLQVGRAGSLTEKQVHFIKQIRSSGEHLLALVNDVLDLAKVEAGKLELHPETVMVDNLFTEVVSMLAKRAEDKQIRLQNRPGRPIALVGGRPNPAAADFA